MNKKTIRDITQFVLLFSLAFTLSCTSTINDDFSERSKIALRDAAHKLLLSQNDTTTLILPVRELNSNTFQLSFGDSLSIEPQILVSILQESLRKIKLPEEYRVEVKQCQNYDVSYSYQITKAKEQTIIPCTGRLLPNYCYLIELKFINKEEVTSSKSILIKFIIILLVLLAVFLGLKKRIALKTKQHKVLKETTDNGKKIGSFKFYADQNKLVKEAQEIALSKKECELLALLLTKPNQIIKRDELTKRVWEDNGVFVGRSLDTYISKLRKKLKADSSIKITNIHGVGYKLEIE
ncbi:winged helix-turn-helix transcriptional regulator [Winogradskyella litoriviva]|uniref:Winged helix-turn-helix transcriptional regulator n=1 Tax=Winogradskyella litoriviva TaxID=1220182 RepID=A0ABX2E6F8_9FLAO|nr:winged helix-turn-helix domain-containing protein [Winogradskyella litoriviva]NRD23693.1 winged helix-turn-helix transcriptional regulator [Winogradskyella litoriviva]